MISDGTQLFVYVCVQTAVPCIPSGLFSCPLVVTMRPVPAGMLNAAVEVTHFNPLAHGAPVHIGDPGTHRQTHTLTLLHRVVTLMYQYITTHLCM